MFGVASRAGCALAGTATGTAAGAAAEAEQARQARQIEDRAQQQAQDAVQQDAARRAQAEKDARWGPAVRLIRRGADLEAAVNARIALEIERQRLRRDVLELPALLYRRIRTKTLGVGREQQQTAWRQQPHAQLNQLGMIALDVEHSLHALGIRERGRIEKDQIECRRAVRGPLHRRAQPLAAIGALEPVLRGIETVELEVLRRPVQIAIGQVDTDRAAHAAAGGVDRGARRIAEQIQKPRTTRPFTQSRPCQAMIEEQAGVEIVVEIHQKLEAALFDGEYALFGAGHRRGGAALLCLRAALAAAQPQMNAF